MPQLNRVRVVNVHFNQDLRCYVDETFSFWGLSGLIHLANGGGKSLLFQVIMHTILGVAERRRASEFFRGMLNITRDRTRTSYCLIEWRLDEPGRYLLIGLCFAANHEGDPHWYLFGSEYSEPNDFDLTSFPIRRDGALLGFEAFRRQVERLSRQDVRVHSFGDDRAKYSRWLRSFRIFREEWELIAESNTQEGGMTVLSERYRTSRLLLEQFMIPQVARALREGDEQEQRDHDGRPERLPPLAQSILEYLDDIRRIPEYQQKITGYESVAERLGRLQIVRRDYSQDYRDLQCLRGELHRAVYLVEEARAAMEGAIILQESQIEGLEERVQAVSWKEASLEFAEKEAEWARLEQLEGEAVTRLEAAGQEERRCQDRLDLIKATEAWFDHMEAVAEAEGYKTRRESMEKDAPDVLRQLTLARSVLRGLLEALEQRLKAAEDESVNRKAALEAERVGHESNLRQCERELNELNKRAGIVQEKLHNAERKKALLSADLTPEDFADPDQGLVRLYQDRDVANQTTNRAATHLAALRMEEKRLQGRSQELSAEASSISADIKQRSASLEEYHKDRAAVVSALRQVGLESQDAQLYTDAPIHSLAALRAALETELQSLTVQLDTSKKQLAWVEGQSRFINNDIGDVHEALRREGMDSLTGLEWLSQHAPRPSDREHILSRFPWLPYSLVLSSRDFDHVSQLTHLFRSLLLRAPVPLVRNGEYLLGEIPVDPNVMLAHHEGVAVFRATDTRKLREQLTRRVEELAGQIQQRRHRIERISSVESDLDRLRRKYTCDFVEQTTRQISALQANHARIVRDQSDATDRLGAIEGERTEDEGKITAAGRIVTLCEVREPKLTEWAALRSDLPGLKDEDAKLKEKERTLTQGGEQNRRAIATLDSTIQQVNQELHGQRMERQGLQRELSTLRDVESRTPPGSNATLEVIRAQVESLTATLNHSRADLDLLRKSEIKATQLALKHLRALQTDFPLIVDTAKQQARRFSEEERAEAKEQVNRAHKARLAREEERNKASLQVSAIVATVDTLAGAIHRQYGRDPYRPVTSLTQERLDLESEKIMVTNQLRQERGRLQTMQKELTDVRLAESRLAFLKQEHPDSLVGSIAWEDIQDCIQAYSERLGQRLHDGVEKARISRRLYDEARDECEATIRSHGVEAVLQGLRALREHDPLAEQVDQGLSRMRALALEYAESARKELARHQERFDLVVGSCLMYAENLYDAIQQIPQYSSVLLSGERLRRRLLQFDFPQREQQEAPAAMQAYILQIVHQLQAVEESRRSGFLRSVVEPANLLNVILPLGQVVVKLAKVLHDGTAIVQTWDLAMRSQSEGGWSGGERYLGALTVYLSLMSFMRNRMYRSDRATMSLLSDNPFGKTSSEHLLAPIRQLLAATRTQWISATDLEKPSIFSMFPIHYTIKPTMLGTVTWNRTRQSLNTAHFVFVSDPDPLHGTDVRERG